MIWSNEVMWCVQTYPMFGDPFWITFIRFRSTATFSTINLIDKHRLAWKSCLGNWNDLLIFCTQADNPKVIPLFKLICFSLSHFSLYHLPFFLLLPGQQTIWISLNIAWAISTRSQKTSKSSQVWCTRRLKWSFLVSSFAFSFEPLCVCLWCILGGVTTAAGRGARTGVPPLSPICEKSPAVLHRKHLDGYPILWPRL